MSADKRYGGWGWLRGWSRKSPQASMATEVSGDLTTDQALRRMAQLEAGDLGQPVNPRSAMGVAACWAAVRVISGACANMDLLVRRRVGDGFENARDSYLNTVLNRRPSPIHRAWQFWRWHYSCIMLRGNAYYLILRGSGGKLQSLTPMHPDSVRPVLQKNGELVYHYARPNDGRRVILSMDQVLHCWVMTLDGINGITPIQYARQTFGEAMSMQRHNAAVYSKGARTSGVFSTEKRLGSEGRQNIREGLDEYRENGEKEGLELILEDGLKFERIGMTHEDMQFVEMRKMSGREIFMLYGMPPFLGGDVEKSSNWGTGLEEQKAGFEGFTLEDYLSMTEDGINNHALPATSDLYAVYDRRALKRANLKSLTEFLVRMVQFGVLNPDEAREILDMNARDGGQEFYPPPNMNGQEVTSTTDREKDE